MIAKEFGHSGPIELLMQSLTQRDYEARLKWLEMQWDRPSKDNYYVMQLTAKMLNMLSSRHEATINEQKIKFSNETQALTTSSQENTRATHSGVSYSGDAPPDAEGCKLPVPNPAMLEQMKKLGLALNEQARHQRLQDLNSPDKVNHNG